MSTATKIVALSLEPLDVLFFRDGRPFAASTRASSGLPQPQTLAGAIWTALLDKHGCDFHRLVAEARSKPITEAIRAAGGPEWVAQVRVRGPWLARCGASDSDPLEVLVSVPAILHTSKGRNIPMDGPAVMHRLKPLEQKKSLPGWCPPVTGLRPLWLRTADTTETAQGYLGRAGVEEFLEGRLPASHHLVPAECVFAHDHRTGIGIEPDRLTSEEGQIYTASFLALRPNKCLYAEVLLPADNANALADIDTLHFGGEGRRVAVKSVSRFRWPGRLPLGNEKPLLVLTTPGHFMERWRPQCLDGHLVAAAVPGHVAVSGWDLAHGGPKPTRFAAAAGSVYFLESLPTNLPDALSDRDDDRQQGWGCYLQGVWNDE